MLKADILSSYARRRIEVSWNRIAKACYAKFNAALSSWLLLHGHISAGVA
jgi:hypothetical protein